MKANIIIRAKKPILKDRNKILKDVLNDHDRYPTSTRFGSKWERKLHGSPPTNESYVNASNLLVALQHKQSFILVQNLRLSTFSFDRILYWGRKFGSRVLLDRGVRLLSGDARFANEVLIQLEKPRFRLSRSFHEKERC